MIVNIKTIPASSCNRVEKIDEQNYKVKTTALPEKGKANRQVIILLAEYFKVNKSDIEIIQGRTIGEKRVKIANS